MIRLRHLIPVLPLVLAACGGSNDSAPSGQVVAKVAGEEITTGELNAELAGVRIPPNVPRDQVERRAVQAIVERKLLANEAKKRKIGESPAYLLQERRADELLLVKMLRDQVAAGVPRPSRSQAEDYIQKNPTMFADRKLYVLDQIQFPANPDQAFLKQIEATQNLDQLEQLLTQNNIEYRRTPGTLDTLGAPAELVAQLAKLPAGEVFVIRQGNAFVANRITEARPQPFVGEKAIDFAQAKLRDDSIQERLAKTAKEISEKGKSEVTYQDKYKPIEPKAAGAKPAAAPAK